MANVDDIFKNVGGSSKRKLEEARDGDTAPRATKLHRIQNDEYLKAGPELPPEDDDDNEEGRFFGGGISKQQADALDYVDGAGDDQGPEKIDLAWLHRKAQNLERKMAKNVEMRAKYEKYPQKFEDSEYSLKLEIMGLSILTEYPELYPEFTKLGFPGHMVGLLAHENTDIVVDVLDVIDELTDENVSTTTDQWDSLVDSLFEADLASLLVSNLGRLGEDEEADRSGALKVLRIVENLCSRPSAANRLAREGSLAEWMIQRIQRREDAVSQTKQYSAEVLAIMSQSSAHLRHRLAALDSADILLQLVAIYRKIDPEKGSFEEEYCKNLFEILTCLVTEPAGKDKFVEAEGVALCLIMFKHGKMSKLPALRLMDCAASGAGGAVVCLRLVNDNGLKPLFTLFMRTHDSRQLYHLIEILASMLQHLPIDSDERIRLLAKLVENDYEKTAKLLRLRRLYVGRVEAVEAKHGNGTFEDLDAERSDLRLLTRLLEAGLYSLQQVDASLAWLVAEDQGARNKIKSMLAEQGQDLSTLAATLQQKRAALNITDTDSQEMGDMLGTLLEFLR